MGEKVDDVQVGSGQNLRFLEIASAHQDGAVRVTGDDERGTLDAHVPQDAEHLLGAGPRELDLVNHMELTVRHLTG